MQRMKELTGELVEALAKRDRVWVMRIIQEAVPEFTPRDGIGDWVTLFEEEKAGLDGSSSVGSAA